jgi:hypothetical protein
VYKILVAKSQDKITIEKPTVDGRVKHNIKMGLGGTGLEYVDQIQLVQYTVE